MVFFTLHNKKPSSKDSYIIKSPIHKTLTPLTCADNSIVKNLNIKFGSDPEHLHVLRLYARGGSETERGIFASNPEHIHVSKAPHGRDQQSIGHRLCPGGLNLPRSRPRPHACLWLSLCFCIKRWSFSAKLPLSHFSFSLSLWLSLCSFSCASFLFV